MGLFSKLFTRTKKVEKALVEAVEYNGFLIYADSVSEGSQYRVAGRITKEVEGEIKTHRFIRSDVLGSQNDANQLMLKKAKLFIDQSGSTVF
ncbi:transcriptional regulator [Vibrio sp. S17_S38]|uniref:HlyU family transcriptional regulator n=1 Tax=Vibrio sp. S17_S38 TaxID=2720229 RepID=UPI001681B552|nr:HlyU family transcriptional regulator [Vibrio sp. S17_S38]MBD1572509.1 transcriptional regulator [Vibrio sp. S17_S38]